MKKLDLAPVVLFPSLIFILVVFFSWKVNYFESLLLFFGVPSLYLSWRSPIRAGKAALFSLLVSIPVGMIFDFLALGDHAWLVEDSVLSGRLFGIIPLEDFVWMFLATYIIVIFYEHFCNPHFEPKISPRIVKLLSILYLATLPLIFLYLSTGTLLVIPYSYLWLCLLFWLIPISVFLIRFPQFVIPFSKVSIFFCYLHFIYELMGLKMGYWIFPGVHYAGVVSPFGLTFPLEELIFVIVLGGLAPCVYYEFFANY